MQIQQPVLARGGLGGFVQGIGLASHAAGFLIRNPRLWMLVLIPLAINMALFIALLAWVLFVVAPGLVESLGQTADRLVETGGFWIALWGRCLLLLRWIAPVFVWVLALMITYFIFTPIALLIAAPFNDRLAEHAEHACGLRVKDDRPLVTVIVVESIYALLCEAKRIVMIGAIFLVLLPLNWLPLIGSVLYVVASSLWACWAAALEFSGYAGERRHLCLRQKWALLRQGSATTMGFGVITVGLMLMPFLNVLMVPISAVGGTFLFCGLWERDSGRL